MFTRIVECKAKPGKREELATKIRNEVLALLQRQSGFVDLITLEDNSDRERFVCLSFWHTREAANNIIATATKGSPTCSPRVLVQIPRSRLSRSTIQRFTGLPPVRRPDFILVAACRNRSSLTFSGVGWFHQIAAK